LNDSSPGGRDPGNREGLAAEEIARYARQIALPEVGTGGQERLRGGSVVLVGAGGLGSPAALYLAAAGVGRIGLVDSDAVELSNLQRQILYETGDVGASKLAAAKRRIEALNPEVRVVAHETRLGAENALAILAEYDVVLDGADNFAARYLVNDACVLLGKPDVHGSVRGFEGQASVFDARRGPCYRCLYPEPPPACLAPSCAESGVLGVLPGLIGAIQATEAIKILLGAGETLVGRLLLFDALRMRLREMKLLKDPACPVCGANREARGLRSEGGSCGGDPTSSIPSIDVHTLKRRLDAGEDILLLDVRDPYEAEICRLPGSLLAPFEEIPSRVAGLDRKREIVCYCHGGIRSGVAASYLARSGFRRVSNLAGGIAAWAAEIDPEMPTY
jgi:adenylyltransferase/sulfurtransferase